MLQQRAGNGIRTFAILLVGQLISVLGSNLNSFALGVWVYQRTNSVTQFTLIALFASIPGLFMAPLAGALVDRWDRRWILIISNILLAGNTLMIILLLMSGRLEIWHIYIIAVLDTVFGAFPGPARAAITPLLIPQEQLGRVIGISQLGGALVQVIAPALAGFLLVSIGLQNILTIDFISFFFVLFSLVIVRLPKPPISAGSLAASGSLLREIAYGWRYLAARPGLMALLILFAVSNFLLGTIFVLVTPLLLSMATPDVLGTVGSIAAFGTLLGSLVMTVWGGPKRRIYGVIGAMLAGGLCVVLGVVRPSVPLFAIAAFGFLFTVPIGGGCTMLIWQTKVALDVQGRVFALSGMVAGLAQPFSFLIAGPLADRVFEPLLAANGALAGSVGQIIGVGRGRGIALMFIVMGTLHLLATVIGYLYPRLRLLEDEVPDAIREAQPEEPVVGPATASV